jgi:hypothetical protein
LILLPVEHQFLVSLDLHHSPTPDHNTTHKQDNLDLPPSHTLDHSIIHNLVSLDPEHSTLDHIMVKGQMDLMQRLTMKTT